jgi:RraA family protein
MALGFRVLTRERKVSDEDVALFRSIAVSNVSDSMSRMSAGGPSLRPMHAGGVMAGPALTVKTRPGDNLMVHKALDMASKGDVVVVDAGGDLTNAIIGELMTAFAVSRGLGGLVINGSIRDSGALRRTSFPVYAAGVTHRGPYKEGPGEINATIAIGGMVIEPGDLILGDDDGVVCIPFDDVKAVYAAAYAKQKHELHVMSEIEAGRQDKSWVDKALQKLGCEFG